MANQKLYVWLLNNIIGKDRKRNGSTYLTTSGIRINVRQLKERIRGRQQTLQELTKEIGGCGMRQQKCHR